MRQLTRSVPLLTPVLIVLLILSTGFKVVDPTREQVARSIVNKLNNEQYQAVYEQFHALVRQNLQVQTVQQSWSNLLVQLGEFERVLSVTEFNNLGYDVVLVRCKFRRDNANVEITLNADNKIFGLYFKP